MSHITESIQGATANVNGEITGGLDYSLTLGHVLSKATGTQSKGNFDASTGLPSIANALKGDMYNISVAGTIYGQTWGVGDHLLINEDMGGTITNSKIIKASGNYGINDYYIFFLGSDTYDGLVELSYDSLTVPEGTYFIQCQPTFGDLVSTAGNTEARMQFVDQDDNPLGNLACINRDSVNPTYPAYNVCVAYVEGPATVKLKFTAAPTGTFPKNGTESNKSPFFLEIMRVK